MKISKEILLKHSQCFIGAEMSVPKKKYGTGICVNVEGKRMEIDFGEENGVKLFSFPDPLLDGRVQLSDKESILRQIELERSSMKEEEKILDIIHDRKIDCFVHYTRIDHIFSILRNGICSIDYMKKHGIEYTENDAQRFDGRPDAISLSVSFPNYKTFYKCSSKTGKEKWCVILLDPQKVLSLDCAFFYTNAANRNCSSIEWARLKDADSFERMFETKGRNPHIPDSYTTDPQAEIMVKSVIPPDFIKCIAFAYTPDALYDELPCKCVKNYRLFDRREDYNDWPSNSTDAKIDDYAPSYDDLVKMYGEDLMS